VVRYGRKSKLDLLKTQMRVFDNNIFESFYSI
jgi:hypothetical protein